MQSSRSTSQSLDLATVFNASQAISEEIVLDTLLRKLIRLVIQNAGAERGFLILEKESKLVIAMESTLGEEEVIARGEAPVDGDQRLSAAIVNYVARTRESVVLRDAVSEGMFTTDPYIVRTCPKSVLCAPLMNQGRLIAVIYLENNLTVGAFTSDRLEVLRLLLAQAALSIHNAGLYANLALSNERLEDYSRTLEQKVEERTRELRDKNEELGTTLKQLRDTQQQLVIQEKLASLGALTAGIAHEIKNPLNFINNFAELSVDLTRDLGESLNTQRNRLDPDTFVDVEGMLDDLRQNVTKINEHGRRANNTVSSMLLHARGTSGTRQKASLNEVLAESVNLAYHAMRSKEPGFNISIKAEYDASIGMVEMATADMSRVFINVINNACYATEQKKRVMGSNFSPLLTVRTQGRGDQVEVRIRDNGIGIPPDVVSKIFHPFFTTKPASEGTGLGLSISYDIVVQGHRGEMKVESAPGEFTEFIITLPKTTTKSGV